MTGGLGIAMVLPILPVYLTDSGLSYSVASVVLAGGGLGAMLGGLPVGAMLGRLGEYRVLLISLTAMALATAALGLTTAVIGLTAMRVAHGVGQIGLRLSRQTFITRTVDTDMRGRSMALMGGSARLSMLIGPILGGVLVDQIGYSWTFAISGAATLSGLVPAILSQAENPAIDDAGNTVKPDGALWPALVRHRRTLIVGGFGPALIMAVRQGRTIIIPLIGDSLDMSASAIGFLVAVGTGADLLLFPVAGIIMDRFGRLATIVPAFSLIGVGMLVLAAAESVTMVLVAGVIMGVGNGIGSGSMLTLGSDLAPQDSPGQFLSALASIQNLGRIIGPMLVGWFADAAGLPAAAIALAVTVFVALAWIVLLVGETGRRTDVSM
jgi:MFS family permease